MYKLFGRLIQNICILFILGVVSEPENEVAEAARGRDGLGQEETRLGDWET